MIFTERTITVVNDSATINKPLILYRGDKNIELKITIAESQFKFRNTDASNVIETTDASYAQLVINTPYNSPIFSDVAATKNGAVIFVITEAMIDEIREVGAYEIQIRLLDDNKQSRASIPPVSNAIEIREPIAIEDGSAVDSNAVNVAKVNRALTTTSAPLEAFDSQGNYIKKTWGDGDPITDAALNKMEAGIDGVNKKIANVNNINDTTASATTTYSSNKIETIKRNISSQIKEKANNENANKRIVCFGDSITHIYAYPRIIGDILGCTTYNVGFAGRCFAGDNPLSMCNVVDAIISKNFTTQETEVSKETEYNFPKQLDTLKNIDFNNIDIVTIAYGTNDCGFNIKIGNINDESKETFAGAINYTIKRLQTAFPHLEIILVTPIFRSMSWTSTDYAVLCDVKANNNQDYLIDFVNMMCEIGAVRNIKVIDNFHNTGINKYNINYYLSDGVHPKVETGVPAIAKSIANGINSTCINNTNTSRDLMENEVIYNSIMKIDNPFSTKHFNRNKVVKVNGMSYLTNYRNDIKYSGVMVGIAKGMCYPLNSKVRIRGKICGSYTGEAKVDIGYLYETPLWGNIYKEGASKGNGVVINIDETEKTFDVIVNTPSSVDKEVLYTCVKILNMQVGNVYVKDITINEIDLNSYYNSSKQAIRSSSFLNGTICKAGEEFGYYKNGVMLKLTGTLDLSKVTQTTFPLLLINIPQPFPQQIRFIASCMYSNGKDGYVTMIISKDGQMSLRDTGDKQVLYIYFYGINICI